MAVPVQPGRKNAPTVKCLICDRLVERGKTFTCRKCRKSPFFFEHLDPECKICSGCAVEEMIRPSNSLLRQEKGVRGFLRLNQFILLVAFVFVAAAKLFHEHIPEFISGNIFFEYVYVWGAAAVVGIVLCYIVVASQKQKIKEIEGKIRNHKAYWRYTFR